MIPDEAVEAALAEWPHWPARVDLVTRMLEAAAPHMMAVRAKPGSQMREAMRLAWEQGRSAGWDAARGEPEESNPYETTNAD